MYEEIEAAARDAMAELLETAKVPVGGLVVVGCSSSEIMGEKIGKGSTPEAAQAVVEAIARYATAGRPIRAVMLARLGPNVWHDSPAAAMATLEELEETAQLWQLCRHQPPAPLSEAQIDELRQTFGASW